MPMDDELDGLAGHGLAGNFDARAYRDEDIGTDPEAEIIQVLHRHRIEDLTWRRLEHDPDFGAGRGQLLAGAQIERHARPALVVDMQAQGNVGLYGGAGVDIAFFEVAAELAAYRFARRDRPHGFEDPRFRIAQRFGAAVGRDVGREQRDNLEQVVLHDI